MSSKYAVITTFPNEDFQTYAGAMVHSFLMHMPPEVTLMVQLDERGPVEEVKNSILAMTGQSPTTRAVELCLGWDDSQKEFMERHKTPPAMEGSGGYRFDYVRFSHKIFALKKAADFCRQKEIDFLIWMDGDVIPSGPVSIEQIEAWSPSAEEGVSYLGRVDWDHSECGFMIFNLKNGWLIDKMHDAYVTDKVLTLPQWHDSYVFDYVRDELGIQGKNLSADVRGRDVFERSVLGAHFSHLKGPLKKKKMLQIQGPGASLDFDELKIQTKNCVENEAIKGNICANLSAIHHWIQALNPFSEKVAICSAGPSLDPIQLKQFIADNPTAKIVAVKHSIERLKRWGIKPWACILLDPRAHVEKFVQEPDPDVIYFVSSMVHPSVVKTLNRSNAKVIGYHALVGAGEIDMLADGTLMIAGGSATATRGISLLETLGFRDFHLFGYDCCDYAEPDLNEKKENGKLVWEKVTFSVTSWGGEKVSRTFWTKGEFVAQAKEFKLMYMDRRQISIATYGDGMIPWLHRHAKYSRQWESELVRQKNEQEDQKYRQTYQGPYDINTFVEKLFNGAES